MSRSDINGSTSSNRNGGNYRYSSNGNSVSRCKNDIYFFIYLRSENEVISFDNYVRGYRSRYRRSNNSRRNNVDLEIRII